MFMRRFSDTKIIMARHMTHQKMQVGQSSKFLIFITGDTWIKFANQDLMGNDISCSPFGELGEPQTIEDCLVRCRRACKAVTHVLSETPQRCCYKHANHWQKPLTPSTCCNHYEPSYGTGGKQVEYLLSQQHPHVTLNGDVFCLL